MRNEIIFMMWYWWLLNGLWIHEWRDIVTKAPCTDRSINPSTLYKGGTGSSVIITTDYGLDGLGIESRWGRDFPPVQTGPGAHPASCKMGTGSFPGFKCGRGVLLTTHPLLVPRSWKSRAVPLPTLSLSLSLSLSIYIYTLTYICICVYIYIYTHTHTQVPFFV